MTYKYTKNETKNILLKSLRIDLEKPSVLIPSKLKSAVKRIDKQTLKEIHKDSKTAREFILYFCSFIHPKTNDVQEDAKGCPLSSELLAKLLAPAPYLKIVEACLKGTPLKGPFVKRENYSSGHHSYLYSIAPCYEKSFLIKHTFKTEIVKKTCQRNILNQFKSNLDNPIIANLLAVYPNLELPESLVVFHESIKKSKEPNYRTKKGKKLHHLNRNPKSRFEHRADFDSLAFIEDHLKLYKKLTTPHLRIPSIQSKYAGGRVTDSITLMPSWIRGLFKINGEFLTECDFTALHPNIIMSLYGGRMRYLDHKDLAKEMGEMKNLQEPEKLANLPLFKTQHLAFFNSSVGLMKDAHPDLWTYYTEKEAKMMTALLSEKEERGYKHTSLRMFTKEVEIMTEAVRRLNDEGIYVLYVYDALLCQQSHKETVVKVMDEVAVAHGVFTQTKAKNLASEPLPSVSTAEIHPDALKCPGNTKQKLPENLQPKDQSLLMAA